MFRAEVAVGVALEASRSICSGFFDTLREAAPAAASGSATGAAVGVGASGCESASSSASTDGEEAEMSSFPNASRAFRSGDGVALESLLPAIEIDGTGGTSSSSSVIVVT